MSLIGTIFICSTNVVMNYTEIEAKVRAATNDEAWGPTGTFVELRVFTTELCQTTLISFLLSLYNLSYY